VGGHIFVDTGLGDMGDNAGVEGDVGRCCHHHHCCVNAGQSGGGVTAVIIALPLVMPIPLVVPLIVVVLMEGRAVVVSPPSSSPCPSLCLPPSSSSHSLSLSPSSSLSPRHGICHGCRINAGQMVVVVALTLTLHQQIHKNVPEYDRFPQSL